MVIQGKIMEITSDVIRGFAFEDGREEPLEITLYINNEQVATTMADQFIEGRLRQEQQPSVNCGFTFNLHEHKLFLPDNADIQIKAGPQQHKIEGSPCFFPLINREPSLASPRHKKVLLVGLPKSGTSILTYRVAAGMDNPDIHFEPAGEETLYDALTHKKIVEQDHNVVTKCLFIPKKQHRLRLISSLYDKKIWIYRDMRDRIISGFFFKWRVQALNPRRDLEKVYEMLLAKENDPTAFPFYYLLDQNREVRRIPKICRAIMDAVSGLDSSWHLLAYEDFVAGKTKELNNYLGFEVDNGAEVQKRFEYVARSKGKGSWRNWFTEEDIDFFRPLVSDYLSFFNYDTDDWQLERTEKLPAEQGSQYIKRIAIEVLKREGKTIPAYLSGET